MRRQGHRKGVGAGGHLLFTCVYCLPVHCVEAEERVELLKACFHTGQEFSFLVEVGFYHPTMSKNGRSPTSLIRRGLRELEGREEIYGWIEDGGEDCWCQTDPLLLIHAFVLMWILTPLQQPVPGRDLFMCSNLLPR